MCGSGSDSSLMEGTNVMMEHCTTQLNEELGKLNEIFEEEQKKHAIINEEMNKVVEKLEDKVRRSFSNR